MEANLQGLSAHSLDQGLLVLSEANLPMKKIVYIVNGPFQLFNCCEAMHRFHSDDENVLVFIDRHDERNRRQTMNLVEQENFDAFHRFSFQTKLERVIYPWKCRELLKALRGADTIYLALYRNLSSHIINTIKPGRVVMFDDGNRLISATKRIFKRDQVGKFKWRAMSGRLLGARLDLGFTLQADYFSLYELPDVPEQQYINNDYRYYKKRLQALPTDNHVDFLGSKMIGYGIDMPTFESLIAQVVAHYKAKGQKLRYITHRMEPIEYMEGLAARLDFELLNLPNIIEVAYSHADSLPLEVATLRTAAVSNVHELFGLPVRVFQVPIDSIDSSEQDSFAGIYRNFASQGFSMESLNV